jgi:hypothetical protein
LGKIWLGVIAFIVVRQTCPWAVRQFLALLGDILLELLLALIALNFTGWLFFYPSYYEKVNNVTEIEKNKIIAFMQETLPQKQNVPKIMFDRHMQQISGAYLAISKLDATLTGVKNNFLWGTLVGLAGVFAELLSIQQVDTIALAVSVLFFVLAVIDANTLMNRLSRLRAT